MSPDIIELIRLEVTKQVTSLTTTIPIFSVDQWDFQVTMASTYPGPGWIFTSAVGGPAGQVYIIWRKDRALLGSAKAILKPSE